MIKLVIYILVIGLLFILSNEFIQGIIRQKHRQKIFKLAQKKSKETSKQLVVFGDPYYGFGSRFFNLFMDGYGCGNETVDLTGAPKCPGGIKSDILEYLQAQKSNSKVIFISCVLEYIDNIESVVKEIMRVSGSIDNVFIVTVSEFSLSAYLYREDDYKALNIIKGPPYQDKITWEKIKNS
jgi:hypothetical protein